MIVPKRGMPRKTKKGQSAIEYLITYSWAILVIAIVVVLVYLYVQGSSSAVPTSCSFTQSVHCSDIIFGNSGGTANAVMLLSNPETYPIINPQMIVNVGSSGNSTGSCTPSYVLPGGTFYCAVTVSGSYPIGSTEFANIYVKSIPCTSGNAIQCSSLTPQTYTGRFQTQYQPNVPIIKPVVILTIANSSTTAGTLDKLTAHVLFGNSVVQGADLNFTASNPTTFAPEKEATDANGNAMTYLSSNQSGTDTIKVSFGTFSNTITVTIIQGVMVTFTEGSGSSSSNVLTVDGTSYGTSALPVTFDWIPGTQHPFSFANDPGTPAVSGCGLTSTRGVMTATTNCTITASYGAGAKQYTLTVSNSGCTSVSSGGTYSSGSTPQISATVPNGDSFSWSGSGSGSYSGSTNPATVTMNGAITETAICTLPSQYMLTINNNGCTSVSGAGTYTAGSQQSASATVPNGYSFSWSGTGSGSYSGTSNPATVTMNGDVTETATCTVPSYVLTVNNNGCTSATGAGTYSSGTQQQVSATVPNGDSLSWSGTGSGSYSGSNNPATVTMNGAITETAICTLPAQYTLTINNNGCTSVSGAGTYTAGSQHSASATVPNGYSFSWSGTGSGSYSGSTNPATVTMNGDITETANCMVVAPTISVDSPTYNINQNNRDNIYGSSADPDTLVVCGNLPEDSPGWGLSGYGTQGGTQTTSSACPASINYLMATGSPSSGNVIVDAKAIWDASDGEFNAIVCDDTTPFTDCSPIYTITATG